MYLPINLDEILSGNSSVEWERIEFKEGWNPLPIIQTLCAFANDFNNLDGGYIFIGIEEKDGKPVFPLKGLNLNQIDKIQKELLQYGNEKIRPSYHPIAVPYEIQGKQILVLRASGGQNRPYQAVDMLGKQNTNWNYYIRRLSSTIKAKNADLTDLLSLAQNVPFDDRFNQKTSLEDLETSLIQAFLKEIGSNLLNQTQQTDFERICRQLNIVGGSSEYPMPHNVGLMFFNNKPDNFFPQTQIDVVRFPDGTGANTIIEKSFKGPLSQQIRDALHYIDTIVIEEFTIKQPNTAEAFRFFNYPYSAIEEILVNAVYHRNYEIREPIEVRVHPDRIEIVSHPGPDRSISLKALSEGVLIARRYRNRRIGEFLKDLRLTEGRGTGIPKVIRAMEENGSPSPIFETDEDRTYFSSTLPIHKQTAPTSGVNSGETTPTLSPDFLEFINEKSLGLLNYCKTPRNRTEILIYMQLKDVKHIRERYLYPLQSLKLLSMTDPEHPLSHNQKFKITKLGVETLDSYKRFYPTLFSRFE
jgi:ATP-dependent DNA helicase RecG